MRRLAKNRHTLISDDKNIHKRLEYACITLPVEQAMAISTTRLKCTDDIVSADKCSLGISTSTVSYLQTVFIVAARKIENPDVYVTRRRDREQTS